MKRAFVFIVILAVALSFSGCRFAIVESDSVRIGASSAALAEGSVLRAGSRDASGEHAVYDLQARLAALDLLDADAPDGIFGSDTEKALAAFQRDNGLEETGALDSETDAALSAASSARNGVSDALLDSGSFGSEVENLQSMLRTYGFSVQEVSGTYDASTGKAVKSLQEYAVARYGTEFDEPVLMEEAELLPVATPTPRPEAVPDDVPVDEKRTVLLDMSAPTPEPTLRPSYPIDGSVSANFYNYLISGMFPAYHETVQFGDAGIEVQRLQNRLSTLDYFYDHLDGYFGQMTETALRLFQQKNDLQITGIADAETQELLYSDSAVSLDEGASDMPFLIKVSVDDQKVYVYREVDGDYSYLIRTMICSTGASGTGTPKGTFTSTGRRDGRWHYFVDFKCWAQYAFTITGNILFHSVLYSSKDEDTLRMSSVYNLGHRASHGCVRLKVEDAKWICTHCKAGQKIIVY